METLSTAQDLENIGVRPTFDDPCDLCDPCDPCDPCDSCKHVVVVDF